MVQEKQQGGGISRREFVEALGIGLGSACVLGALDPTIVLADGALPEKAILYDSTKCIACHTCEKACKTTYHLEGEVRVDGGLNANTWLKVTASEVTLSDGTSALIYNRLACMHCGSCADVCPSKALVQRDDGIVTMNPDKCIGCRYCHAACPFDIPRYGDDGTMRKCILCWGRVDDGLKPACVEACPTGALAFGYRSDLVERGRERVSALIDEGYSEAYLYGDKELGGTPLLHILAYSPNIYGLPDLPLEKQKPMTLGDLWKPLAGIIGVAAIAFGGVSYMKGRKKG